jgi:low temperature requirement protein LtrA
VTTAQTDDRGVRVSTLELFFDLVFVFTLTQLTGLLAAEPDAAGLAKVVIVLSVVWWMYDGYAWLTNALPLDALRHRLLLVGGMAGFLVIALAIPTAFAGSGLAFGLGCAAMFVAADAEMLRRLGIAQSPPRRSSPRL